MIPVFIVSALLASHRAPPCPDCTQKDAVALARVVAHEAGFDAPDLVPIYEVLMRTRARVRKVSGGRGSLSFAADQYSGVATGARKARDDLDRWSAGLSTESAFLGLVAKGMELFKAGAPSPCPVAPHHWGGPMDRPRARAMGMRRIECGTKNDFYLLK